MLSIWEGNVGVGLAGECVAGWEEDCMNALVTGMRVVRRRISAGWGGRKGNRLSYFQLR